jgi:tRNA(Ile)-lysidine synthase
LLTPGERVVVGVSGGPDSLALLHLLLRLRPEYQLQLHVAHLHHGARGAGADADARFVAGVARRWELEATIAERDVPAIAQAEGLAFEEAARRVRYAFLAHVARQQDASKVAVGHNADDQAETVLMHFLRGSGLAGLRGMLPLTSLAHFRLLDGVAGFPLRGRMPALIRPLLEVERAAIEDYCEQHDLQPRFDRSNLDATYFRNRLRHELLPILESYNPNVRRRLQHTARVVAADYELLTRLRRRAWEETILEASDQALVFDLAAWRAQPLALRRALVRQAVFRLRPQLRDVSFVHVENAVRLASEGETGTQATLPGDLMLSVGYECLVLASTGYELPIEGPALHPGEEIDVPLPGTISPPGDRWELNTSLLETWSQEDVVSRHDRWTAHLDRATLHEPLILRTRRPGDRFRPQGMGGHAPRLSDWMINAKIPHHVRDRLPLLVAAEEIVWVCGWRVSETAIVRDTTRSVARFQFQQVELRHIC